MLSHQLQLVLRLTDVKSINCDSCCKWDVKAASCDSSWNWKVKAINCDLCWKWYVKRPSVRLVLQPIIRQAKSQLACWSCHLQLTDVKSISCDSYCKWYIKPSVATLVVTKIKKVLAKFLVNLSWKSNLMN